MHTSVRHNTGKCWLASRAALLILCMSTSGCILFRSSKATPKSSGPKPTFPFDRIELQHLGCLGGGCPVFTVAINRNGVVNYHGYMHVAVTGHRQGRIDAAALRQLTIMLNDPAVFWLRARYTPGNSDCGVWSMNEALIRIEFDAPTFRKQVVHYLGCHSAPTLLTRIENDVDKAADAKQWVRKRVPGTAVDSMQH